MEHILTALVTKYRQKANAGKFIPYDGGRHP